MNEEKMNSASGQVRIRFGNSAFSVPGSVIPALKNARKQDIFLLLALLSSPELTLPELAEKCDCTVSAAESTMAFWRGAGILETEDEPAEDTPEKMPAKPAEKAPRAPKELAEVPHYSSEEVAEIVEADARVDSMLTECQQVLGKVFGQTDNMRLVSVLNYFGLDPEYIVLMCAHCAGIGQKSVGYVVKTVSGLCDRGITTVEALNDYLFAIEKSATLELQVRKLFGMNMARELTEKEKSFISEWSDKYGYGFEIIKRAYEITIDSIGEPSLNYANAILSNWYTADLKTEAQIDAHLKAEKEKKKGEKKNGEGGSFSSEEFFTAALARSTGKPDAPKAPAAGRRNFGVGSHK